MPVPVSESTRIRASFFPISPMNQANGVLVMHVVFARVTLCPVLFSDTPARRSWRDRAGATLAAVTQAEGVGAPDAFPLRILKNPGVPWWHTMRFCLCCAGKNPAEDHGQGAADHRTGHIACHITTKPLRHPMCSGRAQKLDHLDMTVSRPVFLHRWQQTCVRLQIQFHLR